MLEVSPTASASAPTPAAADDAATADAGGRLPLVGLLDAEVDVAFAATQETLAMECTFRASQQAIFDRDAQQLARTGGSGRAFALGLTPTRRLTLTPSRAAPGGGLPAGTPRRLEPAMDPVGPSFDKFAEALASPSPMAAGRSPPASPPGTPVASPGKRARREPPAAAARKAKKAKKAAKAAKKAPKEPKPSKAEEPKEPEVPKAEKTEKAKPSPAQLPPHAVERMRAWFYSHVHKPYPGDKDKQALMAELGITHTQVSNWFINARVRLWAPLIKATFAKHQRAIEAAVRDAGDATRKATLARAQAPTPSATSRAAQVACILACPVSRSDFWTTAKRKARDKPKRR